MSKKTVRDNAYYEDRLKRDFPIIYADLQAGKYRSITDAALAAGLKTKRTRLHEMKNAWEKASSHERRDFVSWLHSEHGIIAQHAPTLNGMPPPIAVGRRLLPWAKSRIEAIMLIRGMKMGHVMREIGAKPLNNSVSGALFNNTTLKPEILTALELWLDNNKNV
ncbi:hypothetical protein [Ochrobactrum sp. EDr1-4]|uniref:hypothetical protein n=1 Tax=Ochrobactrum sp. EDr1-4 TaxID=3368622 RepID=UPI003BA22CC0